MVIKKLRKKIFKEFTWLRFTKYDIKTHSMFRSIDELTGELLYNRYVGLTDTYILYLFARFISLFSLDDALIE